MNVFDRHGRVVMTGQGQGIIAGHDDMTGNVYVHWDTGVASWENPCQMTFLSFNDGETGRS